MKKAAFIVLAVLMPLLVVQVGCNRSAGAGKKDKDAFTGSISYAIELTGGQAEMMAGMMPTHFNFDFGGEGKLKFSMVGGMMASMFGEFVTDGSTGTMYMLKHGEKVAYKMDTEEAAKEQAEKTSVPEVTKLADTETIAGYETQKYKVVTKTEEAGDQTVYMWITKDIYVAKPKNSSAMRGGASAIFVEGVEGFPMKIQTEVPEASATMIMTVDKVEKKAMDKKEFQVPDGYEVKDFDPSMMGF